MHAFQIKVLIQLFASSACFEHHVFTIKKNICSCRFVCCVFHVFI